MTMPPPLRTAIRERLTGTPFVLLLDVDGTLAPIAPRAEEARVDAATRGSLEQLVAMPGVHVVLVSGRGAEDARDLVAVPGAWVIGNHGCERLAPGGALEVAPEAEPFLGAMAAAAAALAPLVAPVSGAYVENKVRTLSVHYRLAEAAAVPALREHVAAVASKGGLRMADGKCLFEVRPPIAIDKGTATETIVRELGADVPGASIACAGDDVSDEDAFLRLRAVFPRTVTVRVAMGPATASAAEFVVGDPSAVSDFLAAIVTERSRL